MTSHDELKNVSEEIITHILQIEPLLEKKDPSLFPPEFHGDVKYLIFGMNPSDAEDKTQGSDTDKLLTFGPALKDEWTKNQKYSPVLVYPKYFDKIWELLEFDKEKRMFWQDPDTFKEIRSKNTDHKEVFEKLEDGKYIESGNNYVLFSDLIFIRNKTQGKITKVIKDNPELRSKIGKFFKLQIEYYKPRFVIVLNSYASQLIEEHLFNGRGSKGVHSKDNITYIFGSMITGGHMDIYSRLRLLTDIKNVVNSPTQKNE